MKRFLIATLILLAGVVGASASVVGQVDRRETIPEFAKSHGISAAEAKTHFSPMGKLHCGNEDLTAQLTKYNDVITTAGHSVMKYNCKPLAEVSQCQFSVETPTGTQTIQVKRQIAIGFHCPRPPQSTQDWAVFQLTKPVQGVTPFRVDPSAAARVKAGDSVLAISAQSMDLKDRYLRRVTYCQVRKVWSHPNVGLELFGTDCDSANGASGGALLNGWRDPVILGTVVGGQETLAEVQQEKRTGIPIAKPYDERRWASFYVPLNGEFLNAVLKGN